MSFQYCLSSGLLSSRALLRQTHLLLRVVLSKTGVVLVFFYCFSWSPRRITRFRDVVVKVRDSHDAVVLVIGHREEVTCPERDLCPPLALRTWEVATDLARTEVMFLQVSLVVLGEFVVSADRVSQSFTVADS